MNTCQPGKQPDVPASLPRMNTGCNTMLKSGDVSTFLAGTTTPRENFAFRFWNVLCPELFFERLVPRLPRPMTSLLAFLIIAFVDRQNTAHTVNKATTSEVKYTEVNTVKFSKNAT